MKEKGGTGRKVGRWEEGIGSGRKLEEVEGKRRKEEGVRENGRKEEEV